MNNPTKERILYVKQTKKDEVTQEYMILGNKSPYFARAKSVVMLYLFDSYGRNPD